MAKITKGEAARMIEVEAGSQIFGVTFIKKNGDLRKMAARLSVKKGVTGAGLKFDPREKGLLVAYDMNNGFRMINIDTLQSLSIRGQVFEVGDRS